MRGIYIKKKDLTANTVLYTFLYLKLVKNIMCIAVVIYYQNKIKEMLN